MSSQAKKQSKSPTLYQRIRNDLEHKILSGEWKPGYRIPFEHELMDYYGCSRMTVNKAISSLVEQGFILRRRRAGSFVARPRHRSIHVELPDIRTEIMARGQHHHFQLLVRRRRVPPRGRDSLYHWSCQAVLELQCLHYARQQPFTFEQWFINLDALPEAEGIDFSEVAPSNWLGEHVAWGQGNHKIYSVNASAEQAKQLSISEDSACLVLEREIRREDDSVAFVKQIFPGQSMQLEASFAAANER